MRGKTRVIALCLCLSALLLGCDFISSLFWPQVVLSDATEAIIAIMNTNEACLNDCTVDAGSTSTLGKAKSPDGTLSIEWSIPTRTYPATRTYIYNGYTEARTGYNLTGKVFVTWNSTDPNTCAVDVALNHDTKLVKSVKGSLTETSSVPSGNLVVNNNTFPITQFPDQYFFSH